MLLTRDPWLRTPGESEEAYAEFLLWLQGARPRPAPHRPELATAWDWGARAAAFDATPAVSARTVADNLKAIERDGFALVALGLEKHLRAELASPEHTRCTPTELMRIYATLKELKGIGADLSLGVNVRKLTDSELDTLADAARLLRMGAAKVP